MMRSASATSRVVRGLYPRIHHFPGKLSSKTMDCRVKRGNDKRGYFE